MRGFLQHAVRIEPTELQHSFRGMSRSRRAKLAKAANTTLVKADQWARGDAVKDVSSGLEQAVAAHAAKKK